jgi:hypothetical protein
VERVRRISAVGPRVGQWAENVQELEYRTRPPVREHQRERVRLRRPDVQEVDAQPIDGVAVLRKGVEPLGESEVVIVGPAAAELLRIRKRQSL